MSARPWVTPSDVKVYTEYQTVKKRSDDKLLVDIARAEQYVISHTHNLFETYMSLPEPVKTAVILIAEAYAHNAVEMTSKRLKSETFDDYSYTAESTLVNVDDLGLGALLDDYIVPVSTGRISMKLRKL